MEIQGPQSSPCSPWPVSLRACAASALKPPSPSVSVALLRAARILPASASLLAPVEKSSQRLWKPSDQLIFRPVCVQCENIVSEISHKAVTDATKWSQKSRSMCNGYVRLVSALALWLGRQLVRWRQESTSQQPSVPHD